MRVLWTHCGALELASSCHAMPSSAVSGTERLSVSDRRRQGVYTRHDLVQYLCNDEDFGRNQAISNPFGEAVLVSSDPNSVRVCNHDDSVR